MIKRILNIALAFPPLRTPPGILCAKYLLAFSRLKIQVDVVAPTYTDPIFEKTLGLDHSLEAFLGASVSHLWRVEKKSPITSDLPKNQCVKSLISDLDTNFTTQFFVGFFGKKDASLLAQRGKFWNS